MEGFGFSDSNSAVRKKRSNTSRRPRNDSHTPSDYIDVSSLSSTPPSETNTMKNEDGGLGESDEASNNCSFRGSNEQRHSGVDSRRSSEGVLAPANWKSTTSSGHVGGFSDGVGNESKVKVKLKVGGITRTINAKSASDGASAVGSSSSKSSRFPDPRQKLIEENLDDNRSFTSGKGSGLRGVPWKDFSRSGLNVRKTDGLRGENLSSKQTDQYEPVRKSKRVPKKRLLDGVLDDGGEDDDEIRYLEKVKTLKISTDYGAEFEDEEGGSRKQRKISRVLKRNVDGLYDVDAGDHGSTRFGKEGKKSKSGRVSEDTDYVEEEELGSDGDPTSKNKKPRKELADLSVDSKKEMTVTTRQRALQTGKDASSGFPSLIEFPNGLPPGNFRPDSVLGEGGFGSVFKGWVDEHSLAATRPGTGMVIAVKRLNQEGFQGHREWLAEINYLGQFQHPNLVKLIGYCLEDEHRLLVYEFMPRGSMENHLFRRGSHFQPLSWNIRMKVALGAARGLAFLHSADAKVIYRDFKTSNILLDSNYNAKLSDFGLARDGPTGDNSHVSTRVMGTHGYAAPEYLATGHLTPKSDVYSFGVVLLEMLSGRRAIDKNRPSGQHNLVEWAKPYLTNKRRVFRVLDTRLEGQYVPSRAQKLANHALQCLAVEPKFRPNMDEVVMVLEQLQEQVKDIPKISHKEHNLKVHGDANGGQIAYPRPSASPLYA